MSDKEIDLITNWLLSMKFSERIEMYFYQQCKPMNSKLNELNYWLSQLSITERLQLLEGLEFVVQIGVFDLKKLEAQNSNYEFIALALSILNGLKNNCGFPDEINIQKEWHEESKTIK